mmetsp:Transcript_2693/g.7994  ORF Transcript_2693/g.7994 Transcript_2693/m.7994 type:complete len:125 (-) Transcript_2693:71-445(-)
MAMDSARKDFRATGKRFSTISAEALGKLSTSEEQLAKIEARVAGIAGLVPGAGPAELGLLKAELAQLETEAKQLETKGVDDVYTGELSSGKQIAKDSKKDMLNRLELLFTKTDEVFATIKAKTA